jgi:hypothetical protein
MSRKAAAAAPRKLPHLLFISPDALIDRTTVEMMLKLKHGSRGRFEKNLITGVIER